MPRSDEASLYVMDLRGGAGTDPAAVGQGTRTLDRSIVSEPLGVHAPEAIDACDAALGGGDRAVAGPGIPEDRAASEAREGTYLLGRRDRHQQSGPDRAGLRAE